MVMAETIAYLGIVVAAIVFWIGLQRYLNA